MAELGLDRCGYIQEATVYRYFLLNGLVTSTKDLQGI